jgi:acyl-CoA synthetase (AMP-forming)/AMP-acid ligase II
VTTTAATTNPVTTTSVTSSVDRLRVAGPALGAGASRVNVAQHLVRSARAHPDRAAILEPHGKRGWLATSFAELDQRCDAIAHGLRERGLQRGDRAAVLVRPGATLIAIVFALFKLGAVPVMIDPGMGRASAIACLARMRPRGFVGVPLAHVLRALSSSTLSSSTLRSSTLGSIEISVCVGRKPWPGLPTLSDIARPDLGAFACADTARDDTAAILFTSGSTGPAKGVVYAHGMFDAQVRALRELYGLRPLERDLACFPLFALFDAALETTCVFPRMDFSRPAQCDPGSIADAILAHGCTYGFASPAVWQRVVPWAVANGVTFPTLTRAFAAGAPVAPRLVAALRARIAPVGDVHVPYGATECLPVASIFGAEFEDGLRDLVESGHGACLGRPAPGIEIAILPIAGAGATEHDGARDTIGEICVRGEVVTRAYAEDPIATAATKIDEGSSTWHRTGDAGYCDGDGRLWTVGRVAHRIETATDTCWPVPLESVCDLHPRARRTALVGAGPRGREQTCLVIEPDSGAWPRSGDERAAFRSEMEALLRARAHPGRLAAVPDRVLFHPRLPVDVRHNAKIRREDVAAWAGEQGA